MASVPRGMIRISWAIFPWGMHGVPKGMLRISWDMFIVQLTQGYVIVNIS